MSNILNGTIPETGEIKGTIATNGTMSGSLGTVFAKDGKSAYEVAVKHGFEGTEEEWLESLKGKSAYELAVINGFEGTEEEWLGNENERVKAEEKREKEEAIRVRHANEMWYAETVRKENENARIAAEEARETAEKNRKGISSVEQTVTSTDDDGVNVYTVTLTDGTTSNFSVKNGSTGNPGIYLGSGDMPEDCNVQIDPEGEVFEITHETGDSETKVMSQKAVTEALANAGTGEGIDKTARMQFVKDRFTANFDIDKLTLDENGMSLKETTGLPVHTNLLWLKGQKDSELLEFTVTVDATTTAGWVRFFVSSREDVNNFLFFQTTVTPQSGNTNVSIRLFYRSGGTNVSGTQITKTFDFVKTIYTYNFKIRIANGILYAYCENMLVGKIDLIPYFTKAKTLGCSFRDAAPNNVLAFKDVRVKEANTPYMHISYDDCISCLNDINTNASTYTSIFNNAFLASLREWHMKYGAVFTLNLFQYLTPNTASWNLANMTTKFKTEFAENAEWLKFAVHWTMAGVKPSTDKTDAEVVTEYNTVANAIINFSSVNNLDRVIRPSYYSLSKSQQIALKNSLALFDGCLTADIARTDDCGLTTNELDLISAVDDYMDFENDIYYCRTTIRMENFTDDDARIAHLNSELADRKNNRAFIVFTHKDDGTAPSLEAVCKWAYEHGIRFDYPMYNIPKFNHNN